MLTLEMLAEIVLIYRFSYKNNEFSISVPEVFEECGV